MQKTSVTPVPDVLERLQKMRDEHASIQQLEMQNDPPNWSIVKEHEPKAQLAFDAMDTIRRLLKQNDAMSTALRNRIFIALENAEKPKWVATHRHYKGTLYRVTGMRHNADHEELEEMVEYDDEAGNKYVLSKRRWEGRLESGKSRYEFLFDTSTKSA